MRALEPDEQTRSDVAPTRSSEGVGLRGPLHLRTSGWCNGHVIVLNKRVNTSESDGRTHICSPWWKLLRPDGGSGLEDVGHAVLNRGFSSQTWESTGQHSMPLKPADLR